MPIYKREEETNNTLIEYLTSCNKYNVKLAWYQISFLALLIIRVDFAPNEKNEKVSLLMKNHSCMLRNP